MDKGTNDMVTQEVLVLPPVDTEGFVNFFWMDIFEDEKNAPGRVYLFGKVNIYIYYLQ
jgi:hypothetical protein